MSINVIVVIVSQVYEYIEIDKVVYAVLYIDYTSVKLLKKRKIYSTSYFY